MKVGILGMDWDGYVVFDPGAADPPKSLPRAEARRVFNRRMELRGERIEMLGRLLEANGVVLGTSDAGVQDLNDWFLANVEADPDQPGRITSEWFSVSHDVGLFLGEVMIERHPNLHWEFFIWGKKNVAYHKHVIMGFSTEDPKFRTNIDIDGMVTGFAHRIIYKQGWIPTHDIVEVRGVKIDVNAVLADHRKKEIDPATFRGWLQRTAERA